MCLVTQFSREEEPWPSRRVPNRAAAQQRAPITKTILKADSVTVSKDVIVKSAPTQEQIAQRAFELYQQRGFDGGALNDWLSAERELRA
jgi:hypothetical protein